MKILPHNHRKCIGDLADEGWFYLIRQRFPQKSIDLAVFQVARRNPEHFLYPSTLREVRRAINYRRRGMRNGRACQTFLPFGQRPPPTN